MFYAERKVVTPLCNTLNINVRPNLIMMYFLRHSKLAWNNFGQNLVVISVLEMNGLHISAHFAFYVEGHLFW